MNTLDKFYNKLRDLINGVFARGTITLVNDGTKMQTAQAKFLADEVLDNLERFQDYGFTSKPKVGAEALAIFFGGRRSNGAIIKVDDRRFRLKGLEDGEVAIYTDEGDKIVLKRGNTIEVTTKNYVVNAETSIKFVTPLFEVEAANSNYTGKITAQNDIESKAKVLAQAGVFAAGYNPYVPGAPNIVNGNLEVSGSSKSSGQVEDSAGTMAQMRSKYNAHKHSESNGPAGTSPPDQTM